MILRLLSFLSVETVTEAGLGESLEADPEFRKAEPALTAGGNAEEGHLEGQPDKNVLLVVGFRHTDPQARRETAVEGDVLAVEVGKADGGHDAHRIFAILIDRFLRIDVAGGAEEAAIGDVAAEPQPLQQPETVTQRDGRRSIDIGVGRNVQPGGHGVAAKFLHTGSVRHRRVADRERELVPVERLAPVGAVPLRKQPHPERHTQQ